MKLNREEEAMLAGSRGPAVQLAMEVLVKMGEIQGAERLVPIQSAHVDGCAYEGDAILEFVEHLADLGGQVVVPTTLNAVSVEVGTWRRLNLPEEFGSKASRIVDAYLKMGLRATMTCSPYQVGHTPAFGEHVAWAESNAIAFANSVLGARTDRYGDFMDIAAALAGRVPEVGLHVTENRRGQVLFTLDDDITPKMRRMDSFYPLLGYYVGLQAQSRIPVVEGVPHDVPADRIKALLAASASSGAVALMHLVGITPEAPTRDAALKHTEPESLVHVTRGDLAAAFAELNGSASRSLDAVALGSPHFSADEFDELAELCVGRHVHPGVRFLITTNRVAKEVARHAGTLAEVERFGAEVVTDTCILLAPLLGPEVKTLMTNSGKYAHYSPGRLNLNVVFGSLADCVASAEAGAPVMEDFAW